MTAAAVLYIAACAGMVAGLAAGGGRYHGRLAAANALLLVGSGLALAIGAL